MDLINKNINDILDINGKHNNFLNDKPLSSEYKKLAEKWSKLPMYTDKIKVKQFFELLNDCQVILLVSGTGSGKTVLVPKFVLKYAISNGYTGKIAITNPKILTTVYNAEYGAKTLDVKLGNEVGYKYKGSPYNSVSDKTRLLYCTDGLILATILGGDILLSEYDGIIIDEAHERHVQIDFLLKLIKEIIPKRPEFKLIIMSATINSSVFRNYFNIGTIKFGEMEVSGESNYQIKQFWLDPTVKINKNNYLNIAIDKCFEIIKNSKSGDILIFVPTQRDAITGCKQLNDKCSKVFKTTQKLCNKLFCIEVYSKMKKSNKDLAVNKDLYKKKGYDRKIIFATNVAESSITIDGLIYVIDTGLELGNYYDVTDNSYVISKVNTSQAQVKQRIGRAGRTQEGFAYHLYTNNSFNTFKLYPEPNISVIDLTEFTLSLFRYSLTVKNMIILIKDMITVPKIEQILYALYKLYFIRAIKLIKPIKENETDTESIEQSTSLISINKINWLNIRSYDKINESFNGASTTIGNLILKFKSSPPLSALAIIMSYYLNCQNEIIKLMAILEHTDGKFEQLFEYKKNDTDKVIKYFSKYGQEGSDHLTILNIYNELCCKYINKKQIDQVDKEEKQFHEMQNLYRKIVMII